MDKSHQDTQQSNPKRTDKRKETEKIFFNQSLR